VNAYPTHRLLNLDTWHTAEPINNTKVMYDYERGGANKLIIVSVI